MVDFWDSLTAVKHQGGVVVPKLWGAEEWLENNEVYCGKLLLLRPGYVSSLHYHSAKDETFVALEGLVGVDVWESPAAARQGDPPETHVLRGWAHDKVRLHPNTPHRFMSMEGRSVVLEVSTPHSEQDVVRIEESHRL